mmetsp:Transcript_5239/g.21145  ORF Transcript_5239/g.21145 Transcript_5239/m.21145 type:complete len:303 (-) Transcript_5239:3094-4002(-)
MFRRRGRPPGEHRPERRGVVRTGRGGRRDSRAGHPLLEVGERHGALHGGRGGSGGGGATSSATHEHALEVGSREHGAYVRRGRGAGRRRVGPDDRAGHGSSRRARGEAPRGRIPAAAAGAGGEASRAGHGHARRSPRPSRQACFSREQRRGHRQDALRDDDFAVPASLFLRALLVPAALGDPSFLVRHHAVGRGVAQERHRRRVRQVHQLGARDERASLVGQDAVQVGAADELVVEEHFARLAVRGDDVAARAERRRPAVAHRRDAVAEVEVAARVEVQRLASRHRAHQEQRGHRFQRRRRV